MTMCSAFKKDSKVLSVDHKKRPAKYISISNYEHFSSVETRIYTSKIYKILTFTKF